MATMTTPRFFVSKPNRDGTQRHYWQAPAYTGARPVALGNDLSAAIAKATDLNLQLDAGDEPAAAAGAITLGQALRQVVQRQRKTTRGHPASQNTLRQYAQIGRLVTRLGGQRRRLAEGPGAWITKPLENRPALLAAALRVIRMAARRHGCKAWDNPGITYQRQVQPRTWSDQAVLAMLAAAVALGRPSVGLALIVNHWLGQRPVDVLALSKTQLGQDRVTGRPFLSIRQQKTGKVVQLPLSPLVTRMLAQAAERDRALADKNGWPYSTALIVSEETGRPYTADAFRRLFRRIRNAAAAGQIFLGEIPLPAAPALTGLRFCWCRHTAESTLADADVAIPGMAAWLGHSNETAARMADTYLVTSRRIAQAAGDRRLAIDSLHRDEAPAIAAGDEA